MGLKIDTLSPKANDISNNSNRQGLSPKDDLYNNPYKQITSPNIAGILVSAYSGVTLPKTLEGGNQVGSYISLQNDTKSTLGNNSVAKPSSILSNLLIMKPSLDNQTIVKQETPKKDEIIPKADTVNHKGDSSIKKLVSTVVVNRNFETQLDQSSNNYQRNDSQINLGNNFGATDRLLLKEYEREIKRQDTNMNEFTGSSTLFGTALVNASMEILNPSTQQQQHQDQLQQLQQKYEKQQQEQQQHQQDQLYQLKQKYEKQQQQQQKQFEKQQEEQLKYQQQQQEQQRQQQQIRQQQQSTNQPIQSNQQPSNTKNLNSPAERSLVNSSVNSDVSESNEK